MSHAIVIGAGMAGLLASRVLADYFERVTLLERDRLPQAPVPRPGIPHARQPHLLLVQSCVSLEQLFPGLQAEWLQAGALLVDPGADFLWFAQEGWLPRFVSGLAGVSLSRDLLDWSLRQRVLRLPQVQLLDGVVVTGLLPTADQTGLAGVVVRHRQAVELDDPTAQTSGETQTLTADLVIDASGKASQLPQWLKALGYPSPQETVVNAFVGYASRMYQPPPDRSVDWKAVYVPMVPPGRTRGGMIALLEGDRWIVGAAGGDRDYPPTDEAGFLDFFRSLPTPALYEAIREAQPLSPIYSYRGTENRWRHYERLPNYPENLLVMGHAACAFNPVYGQGITVAALEAQTLDQGLRAQRQRGRLTEGRGFALQMQRRLSQVHTFPWEVATGQDHCYPGTIGGKANLSTVVMNWYINQIMHLSHTQMEVYLAFLQVMHMLKPPSTLFHPRIIGRVLGRAIAS